MYVCVCASLSFLLDLINDILGHLGTLLLCSVFTYTRLVASKKGVALLSPLGPSWDGAFCIWGVGTD